MEKYNKRIENNEVNSLENKLNEEENNEVNLENNIVPKADKKDDLNLEDKIKEWDEEKEKQKNELMKELESINNDDNNLTETISDKLDKEILKIETEKLIKKTVQFLQDSFIMNTDNQQNTEHAYKTIVNTLKNIFSHNESKLEEIDFILESLDVKRNNFKSVMNELFSKVLDNKIQLEDLGYNLENTMDYDDKYVDGPTFESRMNSSMKSLLSENEENLETGEYDFISQITDKLSVGNEIFLFDSIRSQELMQLISENTSQEFKFHSNKERYKRELELEEIGKKRTDRLAWWLDHQLGVDISPYKVIVDTDKEELSENTLLIDTTTISPDKNLSEEALLKFEETYKSTPEKVFEKKLNNQKQNDKIYTRLFGENIAPTLLVLDINNTDLLFKNNIYKGIVRYPNLENLILAMKHIAKLPSNEVPSYVKYSELKMVDDLGLDTYIDYIDPKNSWSERYRQNTKESQSLRDTYINFSSTNASIQRPQTKSTQLDVKPISRINTKLNNKVFERPTAKNKR